MQKILMFILQQDVCYQRFGNLFIQYENVYFDSRLLMRDFFCINMSSGRDDGRTNFLEINVISASVRGQHDT